MGVKVYFLSASVEIFTCRLANKNTDSAEGQKQRMDCWSSVVFASTCWSKRGAANIHFLWLLVITAAYS
jgi:hypothetical protein